jgi:hypothetical protein
MPNKALPIPLVSFVGHSFFCYSLVADGGGSNQRDFVGGVLSLVNMRNVFSEHIYKFHLN